MPTQQYATERNGPKNLEVSWSGFWKDFTVKFEGKEAGVWTKDELNAGSKEVKLSDGSTFKAHLRRVGMGQELALLRNGQPLPGSSADPATLVKTASGILYFLAGLNALVGLAAVVGRVQFLLELGVGFEAIILGGILGVLGFFTMQRSQVALGIAMAIYALDGVLGVVASASSGRMPAGGVVMHILFLTALWRGFKAMGELKAQQAAASSSPTQG